jgi:hypothetical protein
VQPYTEWLAGFLAARVAEDKARAEGPPGWKLEHWTAVQYKTGTLSGREWRVDAEPRCVVDQAARDDALHIAAYDPARALADAELKQLILDRHPPKPLRYVEADRCPRCAMMWPCAEVRALALVYSAHPDYRAA